MGEFDDNVIKIFILSNIFTSFNKITGMSLNFLFLVFDFYNAENHCERERERVMKTRNVYDRKCDYSLKHNKAMIRNEENQNHFVLFEDKS